ncbi:MarR family winged helix-turn-helix transcriptional regulator [Anaerobranca gottschalkii]|uniref:DNA-binding transcriptional regulator, MarR family n=1 Tax=Anaerobranca gottschalkii DSM 13577 TaxID=1120990 RepID=A0A1I0CCR5_9FIRM|nr:MarR family transcriptional regulator [Anaerobranca gottschalkii]SET17355.1 DNA-binding transcriptional regulator, MarR family [Anaerobranca gottschalkii DSM 13577]
MFTLDTCVAYITDNSMKFITDAFDQILSSKGVTRVQWIALYYLGLQEVINQKELANKMNIKESTVARLIDRMEREGLVIRCKKQDDRRAFNLLLTQKGKHYREVLIPEGEKFSEIVSKGINEEEMQMFLSVLKKMVLNVEEHMLRNK